MEGGGRMQSSHQANNYINKECVKLNCDSDDFLTAWNSVHK